MKEYEDYFRTKEHIESENPESFTWTSIDSSGLAEIMEIAKEHGYTYHLVCYDEPTTFKTALGDEIVMMHRRTMVFNKN